MTVHILRLTCPDRPGIVASIAQGLVDIGANILDNAQHSESATGDFCMRTRFEAPIDSADEICELLTPRCTQLGGHLTIRREDDPPRILIMVSRHDHCLLDLLQRWHAAELPVDIPLVVSNHPDLAGAALAAGVKFEHIPVTPTTKPEAEARLASLIDEHRIDLVVLARYMQILSTEFADRMSGRIINIHHSFLPSFKGAQPYHQAWERGVKVIGATAHFVTADLDEGPIIDQDVARVTHAMTADQMLVLGKDIERVVLSRAVRSWAEGRVFLTGHRTVVFP